MEYISSSNKNIWIGELIKGRDSTKKLQNLLPRKIYNDGVLANDLVVKILGSFSNTLSTLSSLGPGELSPVISPCCNDRALDSDEIEKKPKDRRGCYKRRKTEDSRIKIVDTIEDEFAWRKYGQKEILNAKFPRCYFRCTHKSEGCKALKQVQQLEDGSEKFHVTYLGYHTCQNIHKDTQMFSDTSALKFYLNFKDPNINYSSPSSHSTITNANITHSSEREDDSNAQSDAHHLATSNDDKQSIALWKDIIGNLESPHEDIFKNGISVDDFKFDENVFLHI
uniref:Elicitor-induced DNA-binding protein homolog n=1 Tax=Matricaria chamomilla TaxID=98504 RepID=Q9SST6_9ASTR|nr:elicitor-induced DNA-binding protein homolog [Matricaria chamomilla]